MHIELRDELSLMWFFGVGQTAFERSTLGGMLERAELFSVVGGYRRRGSNSMFDAQPTAELRTSNVHAPDDAVLTRYAVLSRLLMHVERRDPQAATVLEALYGEGGARWARADKPGRLAALYHMTQSGARWLDVAAAAALKAGQPVAVCATMRMANEIAAKQTEQRKSALLAAHRQADKMADRACLAWTEVKREHSERRAA